jgi:tRNA(adenine34) deaminase
MMTQNVHEVFMREAIKEAQKAIAKDEVPVGAILVANDVIIARAHNQVELLNDSTAHAEIIALTGAYANLGTKYLPHVTLYVTLEPCLMCAGALRWGKIPNIVFGAYDAKNGANSFCNKSPYHEAATVTGGVLENECAQLIKDFFKSKR